MDDGHVRCYQTNLKLVVLTADHRVVEVEGKDKRESKVRSVDLVEFSRCFKERYGNGVYLGGAGL